jgi:ABC-type amino acid transport substrate-binding protein
MIHRTLFAALAVIAAAPALAQPADADRSAFVRQLGTPQALRDVPRQWQLPRLVAAGKLTVGTAGTDAAYTRLFEQLARDLGLEASLMRASATDIVAGLAANRFDIGCDGLAWTAQLLASPEALLTSPTAARPTTTSPPALVAESLCVNPRQPELVVAVNTLLGNYRADGTLMRLFAENAPSTAPIELLSSIGYAAHGTTRSGGEASDALVRSLAAPRALEVPRPWPVRNLVATGKLTIANAANVPARFFTDPASGAYRGSYHELFRRLAGDLGLELAVERVAFAGQLPGLAANRFDMACTGTSWTAGRLATTDFLMTGPTGVNATVGMVRNDSPVRAWADGAGRRLGGVRGEIYLESARRNVTGAAQVLEFPGHPEGLLALLNRQADLHAANLTIALNTLQTHPMRAQFRMIMPPLDVFAQSLCVNPRAGDLLVAVNTLLGNYRADGTLARLVGEFGDPAEIEVLRAIGY